MDTGGNLGGLGGRSLPKFEVEDGPGIRPPNILGSTVIGCEAKYELTNKGGIFVLKSSFWVRKSVIT